MAVTINSVTDAQNGGGVAVSVTCTQLGPVTVKYFDTATNTWTTLGMATCTMPPETLIISGTAVPGVLWFLAYDSLNAVSVVYPQALTRASQAIYDKCLDAIKSRIELYRLAGALPGITGTARQRKPRFDSMSVDMPCCLVTPANPQMEPVTNERDQVTYPCVVFIVNTESNQADDDETATIPYHLLSERIRRMFSQQRLSGVTEIDQTRVQYGNHLDWQQQIYEGVQSVINVNCLSREARGI